MLQKYGCIHLVPYVILHDETLVINILKKMADHAVEDKLDFAKKTRRAFITS